MIEEVLDIITPDAVIAVFLRSTQAQAQSPRQASAAAAAAAARRDDNKERNRSPDWSR
jgi:hypothetical protein